jgi:hypothetical protein
MIRSGLALVLLSLSLAATAATPQVDARGRVVRDADGMRRSYGPDGQSGAAAPVPRQAPVLSEAGPRPVTRGPVAKTGGSRARANAITVPPDYQENWRFHNWGWGIGYDGFWPVDVDADGDSEFVYGLGGGQWALADYDSERQEYHVVWKSPMMPVNALSVVEIGNTKNVWIASGDHVRVYDALTRTQLADIPMPSGAVAYAIESGDGNNDGQPDVVVLGSDGIHFFDPVTFVAASAIALTLSQFSFAVGNVDADSAREIVLGDGRVLQVTGANHVVQYTHPNGFGWRLTLGDIDGDARDELVFSATGWGSLEAWDLDTPAAKWSHSTSHDIGAIRLFDVTGDSRREVLWGDGQWGSIHALDGITHAELWAVANPEHGVTDIGVFDADGDGVLELLWGAGASSSGPDYLFVHSVATRAREYRSFDISSMYSALDVGDVDNDGRNELVAFSTESESGYADGVMLIFDAETHELEHRSNTNLFGGMAWTGVRSARIGNIDGDPQPEILVGTDRLYDGRLFVIDGISRAVQHEWPFDSGSPLQNLELADLDGDGQLDVVATNGHAHSGSPGTFIYAINPRTGATLWRSQTMPGGLYGVIAADVGAPGMDILALSQNVLRVRWSDKQQISSVAANYGSLVPMDVTGTTQAEIVAGRHDGSIDVLDGETLAVLSTHAGACVGNPVSGIVEHGVRAVAYVCNGALVVYDLDTSTVASSVDTGLVWANSLRRFTSAGKSAFFMGGEWPAVFVDLGGNNVPTMPPQVASLHWRGHVDVTIVGNDVDDNPLTFQVVGLPGIGTASWLDADAGRLRYVAAGTAKGTDSVMLRAYDGYQFSDVRALTLTLTNTAPAATTSALSFHWRGAQTARLAGNDPNGDPITFSLGTSPTRGTLTLTDAATGDIRFEPTGAFVGTDTLTYSVGDGADASAAMSVQVTLTNSVPTAPDVSYAISMPNTVSGRVNGADANSDALTYAMTTAPSRGTLTLDPATGLFDYVPAAGTTIVTATFVVRDAVSESAPVTVTFQYPAGASSSSSSGGGKKGGGGSIDWWLVGLLGLGALHALRRAMAPERTRA